MVEILEMEMGRSVTAIHAFDIPVGGINLENLSIMLLMRRIDCYGCAE